MGFWVSLLMDLVIIFAFLLAIKHFQRPERARRGNLIAALALGSAVMSVALRYPILKPGIVIAALMIGSLFGWRVAAKTGMIQIPAMVAFQHGAGGISAFFVSFVELARNAAADMSLERFSGILGLMIGAATFSGSMVASAKLANLVSQTPWSCKKPGWWMGAVGALAILSGALAAVSGQAGLIYCLMALILLSILFGLVFSLRIGGADMPVLISFLNATAGLAAAFCGMIIQNRLLVACGATVAASGSILTHVMCRAMNRSLWGVLVGSPPKGAASRGEETTGAVVGPPALSEKGVPADPFCRAIEACREANRIIFVPGYGMALAQAQFKVKELADLLERSGKQVKFAIHPVAGRMPGHMNVLLAEADVPYDNLFAMEEINGEFKETDLAFVVGACDVVNPAAIRAEGTPISGMPILMVHEARSVIVCNLDEKPGYSGVENPLYREKHAILILGDAKEVLEHLIKGILPGS